LSPQAHDGQWRPAICRRPHSFCKFAASSTWFTENAMFDSFQCQCIYVEVSNDHHPHSGFFEYRAKSCAVCQARAALIPADRAGVLFDATAPRYQRMH
jgi:hypothetical protein